MSRETAIREVAEMCAALENDAPKDNMGVARLIVEAVERNLTPAPADGAPAEYVFCECPSCHATGLPELFLRRR